MKLIHWEKVLQEIKQMSNVSIPIVKEFPENWQSSSNWATCQVFLFSPVSYVTLRNYGKLTERTLHFIATYNAFVNKENCLQHL